MADEITITINAQCINGNFKDEFKPGTVKYDQGTVGSSAGTVAVTSDSTTLDKGPLGTSSGWCFLANLSTSVEILLGPSTAVTPLMRLPISSYHVFHTEANTTITVHTTTGTANLQYLILST